MMGKGEDSSGKKHHSMFANLVSSGSIKTFPATHPKVHEETKVFLQEPEQHLMYTLVR